MDALATKIADKSARVSVIGLGYVGLPLAVGFARAGYAVLGLDVDERKVAALNEGRSFIQDVDDGDVMAVVQTGKLSASNDYDLLKEADAIFICVPTPFDAMKAPDLTYIQQAAEGIASRLRPGQIVILQSTTYPGTTEEFVLPILEESGLKAGQDFSWPFRRNGSTPAIATTRWKIRPRSWAA